MSPGNKRLVRLYKEVKSPSMTSEGKQRAAFWLKQLLQGQRLSGPHSKALPVIGPRCHELRVKDKAGPWRILYRIDPDAIVIIDVYLKKSNKLPQRIIRKCKQRLKAYDAE